MKTITGKAVVALLIALALLTLFFFLLAGQGLSLAVSGEAATVEAKMDSIADLVNFLHSGERERTSDWLKENNERTVRLMSGALRRYADGDGYTGPRLFPESAVIEVRGSEAIYPEGMPEGFIRLTEEMIAGLSDPDRKDCFLGFMTETSGDGDMTWNGENIDVETEAEKAVTAALFYGKIADHFYYVEKTSGGELDEYIDMHVGISEAFQAAEQAYGGAILELDDDLTLCNESTYFPGVKSATELGLTREMIGTRAARCKIRDVMYQCVCRTEDSGRLLIYLHPTADIEEQSYRVSALISMLLLPFFLALICYVISAARHVRACEESNPPEVRLYAPGKITQRIIAGGLISVLTVALTAMLIQDLGMLYTKTQEGLLTMDTLVRELRESEAERNEAVVREEEEWYVYYGQLMASLIAQDPAAGSAESLRQYCETLGIDYIMLFDAQGNETACSRDYTKFTLGRTEDSYLHDFRRLLMGIPVVRQEAAYDPVTELTRQMIGVTVPDGGGNPGALLMALEPEQLKRTLGNDETESRLPLLSMDGTACLVTTLDGTITESSFPKLVGNTVMQYGLPESSLRDGYMDFVSLENHRYYVVTDKRDAEIYYYLTDVSMLFGGAVRYGLFAAAGYALILTVLAVFLLTWYRRRVYQRSAALREADPTGIQAEEAGLIREREHFLVRRSIFLHWKKMLPEERTGEVFRMSLCLVLIGCLLMEVFGKGASLLYYILMGDWMRGLNRFALCAGLTVLLAVFLISYLLRQVLMLLTLTLSRKGETICWLVYDFAAYMLLFVAIYYIFGYAGFPTSTVLTSVGLATLAVTLGAQGLVADVLAGIAIAFEGDFNVGDIVEVEGFLGTVKEIGIRTTKIVDTGDDIKIVQNSQIKNLVNKAAYHSSAVVQVHIPAKESLPRVEKILEENLPRIGRENEKILSAPTYLGVSSVCDKTTVPYEPSLELLIIAPCREEDRSQVTRDLNREILLLFEKEKIRLL